MNNRKILIGSRESKLAIIQSEIVLDYIKENNPGIDADILTMKTTGDMILDRTLDTVGGKDLFVKELDRALIDGRSDISVHSLKDMPIEVNEELPMVAYSRREDPRDVLVFRDGLDDIDYSKPVGCASRRRMLQLQALYPGVTFKPIRGNVLTRLEKLDSGEYGATILAAAGLKRLGLEHRAGRYFEPDEMIPSAGQGILVVQGRNGDNFDYLEGFNDEASERCSAAERTFIRLLNGGCTSPIAAFASIDDDVMTVRGLYYSEETGEYIRGKISGAISDSEKLGCELARRLKEELEG